MNSSRFAHFNTISPSYNGSENSMDTQDNNNTSSNDNMIITAGMKYHSPANAGTFVTAVVNGHQTPSHQEATIFRPSDSNGGQEEFITYNNLKEGVRENGFVGSVSFKEEKVASNGWIKGISQPVTFPLLNPLKPFNINVRILKNSQRCSFDVLSTDTVEQLKELIKNKTGLKPAEQKLVFAGKNLTCGMTLGYYGLKEGDEILLTCHLRGG